mgnify:CR=1 FL=1
MATSKKNAKGNKTAHVLNLLTAPGAPKEGAPAAEETAPAEGFTEQPAAAPSRPLLPPILEVAQSNDDNLAQQIQQALEEELEASVPPPSVNQSIPSAVEEVPPVAESILETTPAPSGGKMSQEEIEKLLSASTSAPEPEPAPPASSGGKMSQEEIEKLLSANSPAEPAAPAPEPAAAPAPAKPVSKPAAPSEEDISYTNIMQVLVEEKAPAYIKKFGLCSCKQCEADVKALTLTNLVPKYVVLSKLDRIPMLTVYEGRFNSTVFAQLTRACKVVMDHPHHNRNQL